MRVHDILESTDIQQHIKAVREKFPHVKQVRWTSNVQIGWWRERKSLMMFHGTHYTNLAGILSSGLHPPSSGTTAGRLSMAFEPNTAFGYAVMGGGETNFRDAGHKARSVPPAERVVLVAKLPMQWVEEHMDPNLKGNLPQQRKHLTDRDAYEQWSGGDAEYYQLAELQFPMTLPAEFIVGFMRK
jgi:hypothetical protein